MKNGKIYNIALYSALYITYNGFPIGEFAVKVIPWYSEFLLKLYYRQWKETCMKSASASFNIFWWSKHQNFRKFYCMLKAWKFETLAYY